MEYEDGIVEPIFGAFYVTPAYCQVSFNYFREDADYPVQQKLKEVDEKTENDLLKDNNLIVIKNSPEYITNKQSNTPTNRILISLFSRERLKFILQYVIVYVEEVVRKSLK